MPELGLPVPGRPLEGPPLGQMGQNADGCRSEGYLPFPCAQVPAGLVGVGSWAAVPSGRSRAASGRDRDGEAGPQEGVRGCAVPGDPCESAGPGEVEVGRGPVLGT